MVTPLVLQIPIGAENEFAGLVDLITMKALVWNGEELGATYVDETEIPAEFG